MTRRTTGIKSGGDEKFWRKRSRYNGNDEDGAKGAAAWVDNLRGKYLFGVQSNAGTSTLVCEAHRHVKGMRTVPPCHRDLCSLPESVCCKQIQCPYIFMLLTTYLSVCPVEHLTHAWGSGEANFVFALVSTPYMFKFASLTFSLSFSLLPTFKRRVIKFELWHTRCHTHHVACPVAGTLKMTMSTYISLSQPRERV